MARRTIDLTPDELDFLAERQLATLTTLRPDDTPHVVAIAFTFDPGDGIARVITSDGSQKVHNVARVPRVALCQVDGARWLTLEGTAVVRRDAARVAQAVALYERRYRPLPANPKRVAMEIAVDRILGRA